MFIESHISLGFALYSPYRSRGHFPIKAGFRLIQVCFNMLAMCMIICVFTVEVVINIMHVYSERYQQLK